MIHTVMLKDGTDGKISCDNIDELFGKTVDVETWDENGNFLIVTGEIVDVLESKNEWE